ncbi:MAG: carbonic anhydrase [Bacteroidetes bacterium]|nr:MAG: carbonic anhydrase [Bacteroidota bacterium]
MGLTYKQVFENNRLWVAEKKASDSDFFSKLEEEQHPDYLYIGCSDSRVPAEIFMGAQPGEVFVHRNIANQVALSDQNALSVIHFAVDQLRVKHIVVCGHYMCGGVQAAMERKQDSPLDPWFDQVREVAEVNRLELERLNDVGERFRRLVELNVEAQCRNVLKREVVKESIRNNGSPTLHGWVFDIHSGGLIDLDFQYDPDSI